MKAAPSERVRAAGFDARALVEAHWDSVYRLLYRLTGNAHEAEDLTQETFYRALDRREKFLAGTNLRAWVMRIATNAFLDIKRRQKVIRFTRDEQDRVDAAKPGTEQVDVAESAAAVRQALLKLPEAHRAVFLLRCEQEVEYREIAEMLGIAEATARSHMLDARRMLMKELEGKI